MDHGIPQADTTLRPKLQHDVPYSSKCGGFGRFYRPDRPIELFSVISGELQATIENHVVQVDFTGERLGVTITGASTPVELAWIGGLLRNLYVDAEACLDSPAEFFNYPNEYEHRWRTLPQERRDVATFHPPRGPWRISAAQDKIAATATLQESPLASTYWMFGACFVDNLPPQLGNGVSAYLRTREGTIERRLSLVDRQDECLHRLPLEERQVLILRYGLAGHVPHSYREIADKLDYTSSSYVKHLHAQACQHFPDVH